MFLAGVLIGLGSQMGSGCTMGHGIIGNIRRSGRSFLATVLFVLMGSIATQGLYWVKQSGQPSTQSSPPTVLRPLITTGLMWPEPWPIGVMMFLLSCTLAFYVIITMAGGPKFRRSLSNAPLQPQWPPASQLRMLADLNALVSGLLVGLGVGYAGLLNPAHVLGAFCIFVRRLGPNGIPALELRWNPTLFIVAIVAILSGSFLCYVCDVAESIRLNRRAYLAPEYNAPQNAGISAQLVLGSALFGVGWGLGGMCVSSALGAVLCVRNGGVWWWWAGCLLGMFVYWGKTLSSPSPTTITATATSDKEQ